MDKEARTQLDPKDTWTPGTLGPRGHLDPKDIWTPGTLGPLGHLDPGDIWTPGTLGPWTFGPQDNWTPSVFRVISHNGVCSSYVNLC